MQKVQVGIRFPTDMKAWLENQARLNGSSQNSEVIRAVREKMTAAGGEIGVHSPAAKKAHSEADHQEAHSHAGE